MAQTQENEAVDETTQLLNRGTHSGRSKTDTGSRSLWAQNLVLLLGVFLVNSDNSILLANFRQIASDFDQLQSASWIITSNVLGVIFVQPLYGRLSDIYGRKPILVVAYSFQCIGNLLGGLGFSFGGVLAGRVLTGFGTAGITVLVSTLIVDIVPKQEVAEWRSYVYAVNQVGRAVGPSIGGIISDRLNWRWALFYPFPLMLVSLVVIIRSMSFPNPSQEPEQVDEDNTVLSKIRRIDFLGTATLGLANCSLLFFLGRLQTDLDITHNPLASICLAMWLVFLAAFVIVEAFWAREPVLPLRLLVTRNVFSSYAIQFLQTSAQMALYTSIPLFARITMNEDSTTTALRLLIISVGVIVGGLISGVVIKRTGLYRLLTCVSLFLSSGSYLAIYLRWRGPISWLEMFYAFLAGIGFGVSLSSAFIALTANLQANEVAVSTSGFYLSLNLGSMISTSVCSLLISTVTRQTLARSLKGDPNAPGIIKRVTSNLDNISGLQGRTLQLVLEAYTNSIIHTWLFALACGCLAFVASFIMTEGKAPARKGDNDSVERQT